MPIRNMGEFSDAARLLRTYYKKNHAGEEIVGVLNSAAHVRTATPDEAADHQARYGFKPSDGVGSFVGERYSADLLREVVNHASNPLGFDAAVLPYNPTPEDAQDCKLVAGLWNKVVDIRASLVMPGEGGGTTNPPASTSAEEKLKLYQQAITSLGLDIDAFDLEIPVEKGGKYAQAGREFLKAKEITLTKLRDALAAVK